MINSNDPSIDAIQIHFVEILRSYKFILQKMI